MLYENHILPIHKKIKFLYNIEILRELSDLRAHMHLWNATQNKHTYLIIMGFLEYQRGSTPDPNSVAVVAQLFWPLIIGYNEFT